MQKFSAQLQPSDSFTFLGLRGVIDEDNTLRQLTTELAGDALILDLSEIERINSCGVRDWVNWLNDVEAHGFQVVLIRCSPAIINQVNMVTNFAGDAFIHSFFAPYLNPDTDEEKNVLLFTEALAHQNPVRAPAVRSDDNGRLMEFDDFEESYFAFVPDMASRDLDPKLEALIAQAVPDLGEHLSQDSEIVSAADTQTSLPSNAERVSASAFAPADRDESGFVTDPREARKLSGPGEGPAAPGAPTPVEGGPNTGLMIGLGLAVACILAVLLWMVLG